MKLLDYIMATRDAQSEEDVATLLTLTNPELSDRDKMGKVYEESLGYNPLEAFDEKEFETAFDAIYEVAPTNVQDQLDVKRDEIIEKCVDCLKMVRADVIEDIAAQAIKVETGWIDPDMEHQIPLAIIRFLSGDEDGFEIDLDDDTEEEDEGDYDSSDEEDDDELNLELAEMLGDDID